MNKAQREVAEYLLDKEERIIKQLERQFKQALEDVEMDIRIMLMDEQTPSRIHRVEYQKRLRAQIESTLENLHRNEYKTINQFLQDSYKDSFVGTMYDMHSQGVPVIVPIDQNAAVKAIQLDTQLSDRKIHPNANGEHVTLYESLGVDVDNLKEVIRQEITRGLATNMLPENIARNIANLTKAPLSRAKTIARTEAHRIQEASAQDARERAISRGARVVKQWDATMDGATREAHRRLDGQIVEVKEPFTYGTLTAMYPGDFGDPAQDCNCRCKATQRAKWMLDEEELEEQKRRAEFFGLGEDEAKKQQFAEFEKKYLKAAETVETEQTHAVDAKTLSNYEYTIETAYFTMESNFEMYRSLPEEYHAPFDTFEAETPKYEQQLASAFEKFDFASNTDSKAIEQILRDGKLKGTVETNTSNGELDVELRKRATGDLFGLYEDVEELDPSEFEKYGYLGTADRAKMYGDCRIVFKKDNLWDRTTFTVGDSLEAHVNGGYKTPSRVSDPKIVSFSKAPFTADKPDINEIAMRNIQKAFDSIEEHGYFKGVVNNEDYVELQFHGAVTTDDIAFIEVPKDCENLVEILEIAEEKGVKVKVRK